MAISTTGHKNFTRPASLSFAIAGSGLNEIEDLLLPTLHSLMMNVTIPPIKVKALGIVVEVSNISLTKLDFGNENIQLNPPNVVTISGSEVLILATMNWHYHDGLIKIHGTAEDVFNQTNLAIDMAISSKDGRLQLDVVDCNLDIKDFCIILDGGAGGFYQDIVNMLHKPLKNLFSSTISQALEDGINAIALALLPSVPVVIPLSNKVEIDYALINVTNDRGMSGYKYSNNHFSGSSQSITVQDFDISVDAYDSIDISGYFQPSRNGTYSFQIHFKQAAQITTPGGTAGHLEMHNPGMCWVQYHTDKTSLFNASSAVYYPINLKYQSGCGGGHIQVSVCEAGASCELLSSLNITTNQTEALPVFVDHTAVLVSAGAEMFDTQHPVESPFPHLQLPTVLPPNFNQSLHSIAVYLDPFLLNSGLSVLNAQGVFNFTLTNDDIPPAVQPYFQLNTTFFRYIFPNLYNKFPNDALQLDMAPLQIEPIAVNSSIRSGFLYAVNVSVLQGTPRTQVIPAMKLEIHFKIDGSVSLENTTLAGNISSIVLTTTLTWAIVPVANVSGLNPIIAKLLDNIIIPSLNKLLNKGLPLPIIGGIEFVNTEVIYNPEGIVTLLAGFQPDMDGFYQPSFFARAQSGIQTTLRPALWLRPLAHLHSSRKTWSLKNVSIVDAKHQILEAAVKQASRFQLAEPQTRGNTIQILSYTKAEWLDVIEFELQQSGSSVLVVAHSFSSGLFPVCIPGAPILNMALCFVPFLDHGFNKKRLDAFMQATIKE
eukprot:gene7468-544_t